MKTDDRDVNAVRVRRKEWAGLFAVLGEDLPQIALGLVYIDVMASVGLGAASEVVNAYVSIGFSVVSAISKLYPVCSRRMDDVDDRSRCEALVGAVCTGCAAVCMAVCRQLQNCRWARTTERYQFDMELEPIPHEGGMIANPLARSQRTPALPGGDDAAERDGIGDADAIHGTPVQGAGGLLPPAPAVDGPDPDLNGTPINNGRGSVGPDAAAGGLKNTASKTLDERDAPPIDTEPVADKGPPAAPPATVAMAGRGTGGSKAAGASKSALPRRACQNRDATSERGKTVRATEAGPVATPGIGPGSTPRHEVLSELDFVHGAMSRGGAERAINAAGSFAGTFLVRSKNPETGLWVLSVSDGTKITHHLLQLDQEGTGNVKLNGKPLPTPCTTLGDAARCLNRTGATTGLKVNLAGPVSPRRNVDAGAFC